MVSPQSVVDQTKERHTDCLRGQGFTLTLLTDTRKQELRVGPKPFSSFGGTVVPWPFQHMSIK
jgi:hypothetical protein